MEQWLTCQADDFFLNLDHLISKRFFDCEQSLPQSLSEPKAPTSAVLNLNFNVMNLSLPHLVIQLKKNSYSC